MPCSPNLSARSRRAVSNRRARPWPPRLHPTTSHAALSQLAALRAPIDGFFADVMVMDEDAALRDNRLRLLNRFVGCVRQRGRLRQDGEVQIVPVTVFNR